MSVSGSCSQFSKNSGVWCGRIPRQVLRWGHRHKVSAGCGCWFLAQWAVCVWSRTRLVDELPQLLHKRRRRRGHRGLACLMGARLKLSLKLEMKNIPKNWFEDSNFSSTSKNCWSSGSAVWLQWHTLNNRMYFYTIVDSQPCQSFVMFF